MYRSSYYNSNKTILNLPKLLNIWKDSDYYIIWKIYLDFDYFYSSAFIKFIINTGVSLVDIELTQLNTLTYIIYI